MQALAEALIKSVLAETRQKLGLTEMNFAPKGTKVKHPKHGQGTVVACKDNRGRWGAEGDEAVKIKTDDGKSHILKYTDKGPADPKWRRVKVAKKK